eukprot:gene3924-7135_t
MNKIQSQFSFVIYGTKWINPNTCCICGGGGQGIPNVKQIDSKKKAHEIKLDGEMAVPLQIDVNDDFIIFTTLEKLYLLSYDKEFKMKILDQIDLISKAEERYLKCILTKKNEIFVSDDSPKISKYNIKKDKLSIDKKITDCKKSVKSLDFNEKNEILGFIEDDYKFNIFDLKNEKLIFEKEMKEKIKVIKLSNESIFILKTNSKGPSNLLKFKKEKNEFELKNEIEISKKSCNTMSLLQRGESEKFEEFLGFSIQNGITIYNGTEMKKQVSNFNLHSFSMTCSDLIGENENELKIISGSLDQTVVVHQEQVLFSNKRLFLNQNKYSKLFKEGVDFIKPTNTKEDLVEFTKTENFFNENIPHYFPNAKYANKETHLDGKKIEEILKEKETKINKTKEYEKFETLYEKSEDTEKDFDELYRFLTNESLETKLSFLNFLKEIDREDIVLKVESLYIKRMIFEANKNIEIKKDHLTKFSTIEDDGFLRRKINENERNAKKKLKKEEEEEDELIKSMTPSTRDLFKLVPNKRFSSIGISNEGDFQDRNSKLDPNDNIFKMDPTNDNEKYFQDSLLNELNELKKLSSAEISREGYGGHPNFDRAIEGDDFSAFDDGQTEEQTNMYPSDMYDLKRDEYGEHASNSPGVWLKKFEETILFKKRTSIRSTEGRRESECCFVLIGSPYGFVGVGFGFAASAVHALEKARKKAFLNIRSVEATNGTIIQKKIKKKYKKSIVEMQKSTKSGIRAHPVLKKMCEYLQMDKISIKCHGSRNILTVIPAFYKCLDEIVTLEEYANSKGLIPIYK